MATLVGGIRAAYAAPLGDLLLSESQGHATPHATETLKPKK